MGALSGSHHRDGKEHNQRKQDRFDFHVFSFSGKQMI
jgi:hypothetical protein